jgi:hypothetical protein
VEAYLPQLESGAVDQLEIPAVPVPPVAESVLTPPTPKAKPKGKAKKPAAKPVKKAKAVKTKSKPAKKKAKR